MGPAPAAPALEAPVTSWKALWQTLTRFEWDKITPSRALRNALGVILPLAVGVAMGRTSSGLIVASGALNVCFSDGDDPYRQRALRMLSASLLVGFAVLVGTLAGPSAAGAVALATSWAFAAGMMVALSQTATDLGVVTLVTLIVFSVQPITPAHAVLAGLLALGGGLIETALALALWPVRKHEPERRALANLYHELSRAAASPPDVFQAPPASAQSIEAQVAVATLGSNHSIEADRYRLLLSQAERVRLGLLTLARFRIRILREKHDGAEAEIFTRFAEIAANLLASIGASLIAGGLADAAKQHLNDLDSLAEGLRAKANSPALLSAMIEDARRQMDAIAGQIRSAIDLAANATPEGLSAFERREAQKPRALRLSGSLATLRANLTLDSAACRHAIRLAVCIAIGDAIGRGLAFRRSYWIPMTIALVLKPDFTATFSRGVLRMVGTLTGLGLATVLFHLLSAAVATQIVLVGLLTFVLRCFGATNYGVLTATVSALVVFLIALTGVAPQEVVAARGVNSIAGGSLALLAYWLWPTWERHQVPETMAHWFDAYRDYFRTISLAYIHPDQSLADELDRARQQARLARSNLQASLDRLSAEPGASAKLAGPLAAMIASGNRLVHALMALEAGLYQSKPVPPRPAFQTFSSDVERTLYFLAAGLRGSTILPSDLPDLREDHHALLRSGDSHVERYALVNVEADRVTNSLNTLREQVLQWLNPNAL